MTITQGNDTCRASYIFLGTIVTVAFDYAGPFFLKQVHSDRPSIFASGLNLTAFPSSLQTYPGCYFRRKSRTQSESVHLCPIGVSMHISKGKRILALLSSNDGFKDAHSPLHVPRHVIILRIRPKPKCNLSGSLDAKLPASSSNLWRQYTIRHSSEKTYLVSLTRALKRSQTSERITTKSVGRSRNVRKWKVNPQLAQT